MAITDGRKKELWFLFSTIVYPLTGFFLLDGHHRWDQGEGAGWPAQHRGLANPQALQVSYRICGVSLRPPLTLNLHILENRRKLNSKVNKIDVDIARAISRTRKNKDTIMLHDVHLYRNGRVHAYNGPREKANIIEYMKLQNKLPSELKTTQQGILNNLDRLDHYLSIYLSNQ